MATIHFHETTHATPKQFVEALTNFAPSRSELFGNSADGHLTVHDHDAGRGTLLTPQRDPRRFT